MMMRDSGLLQGFVGKRLGLECVLIYVAMLLRMSQAIQFQNTFLLIYSTVHLIEDSTSCLKRCIPPCIPQKLELYREAQKSIYTTKYSESLFYTSTSESRPKL